ncbi:MAG: 2-phosphoglycerate kinase [Paenibacillaceae bacterium]|jgi:putative acetyltransferase|nr:2-phosphoglycerate kinase [Paenibacillaceae bacterium]
MIILISGSGYMGKTYMAQNLLEKYKISYFSIDHLKMGIYRGMSNCGFTPTDSTEVIGDRLWPIIKGIIMTNIENKQSLIMEGCYILPHYLKEFEKNYRDKIIPVFLGFSTSYIQENYETKIIKNRCVIEDRGELKAEDISEFRIKEYMKENEEYRTRCNKYGEKFFEIRSNYEKEIAMVYDYIDIQKQQIESGFEEGSDIR